MNPADNKLLQKLQSEAEMKTTEDFIGEVKSCHDFIQERKASGNVPSHLQGLDNDIAVLRILAPFNIYGLLNVGIYNAYQAQDMAMLNDALFSYNRIKYYRDTMMSSGYDHCIYFLNVMENLAGNDLPFIRKIFRRELGLTKTGHKFLVTASNLTMALLWNDEKWKEESLKAAEKFLIRKNGRADEACVQYLISLINQDIGKASAYLAESCSLYKKNGLIHNFGNPFLKVFGAYIHGLYNLAYHLLPAGKFELLAQPDHTVFWKEFAAYNISTGFIPGKPFIIFENELSGLNKVYE